MNKEETFKFLDDLNLPEEDLEKIVEYGLKMRKKRKIDAWRKKQQVL